MGLKQITSAIDNNKKIDDEIILNYAKSYINYNKLNDYIKEIEFAEKFDKCAACYRCNRKKIEIYRFIRTS